MTKVFIDTSALLPLLDRDDGDHEAVVQAVKRLGKEKVDLVTTSYVLVESGALAWSRLGLKAFAALGETVRRSMDVVWIDEEIHTMAWTRAAAGTRNGPGLVDWASFLTMKEQGIDTALALDRHFTDQGFRIVP
jgi:predicted nucleic acid-binding protein